MAAGGASDGGRGAPATAGAEERRILVELGELTFKPLAFRVEFIFSQTHF